MGAVEYLPVVICFPLTTKIKNYKGNLVLQPDAINNLTQASEVLTFHVRSVAKERLQKKTGSLTELQISMLKQYLNEILTY